MQKDDQFTKWMLTVTAAVTVALIGGIFTTILALKEDMAQVKEQMSQVKSNVEAVTQLQHVVQEHEIRIRWIENGATDNKSGVTVYRDYKRRDTRGVPATHPD